MNQHPLKIGVNLQKKYKIYRRGVCYKWDMCKKSINLDLDPVGSRLFSSSGTDHRDNPLGADVDT